MKKNFCLTVLVNCLLVVGFSQSKYDARKAFDPNFYTQSGNDYRSAAGEPGPKYWQNRADYKLACTLDTGMHTVTGTVEINYTNNSPDNLRFLWLQVDQNIYQKESRASATTTEAGGRWANSKFTQDDVIKSISVEDDGKKYNPQYN